MLDLKNHYVIAGLISAAAIIGVGIYLYITKYRSKPKVEIVEEYAKVDPAPQGPTFAFFYATWCPHCESMMGDWKQTENALKDKIDLKSIESNDPEMANHKIPGFPTLRMFPKGIDKPDEYVDYKGPRKAENIIKFVMDGPEQ